VGVREVPPLLLAGMRFFSAGIVLYAWMRAKGTPSPTLREWKSAAVLATLIFVCDYGLLFWAEKRVPSGIAAVMLATIPAFMALSEILFLRTQCLTVRLGFALLLGLAGVAVLMSRAVSLSEKPVDTLGAMALIASAVSWSLASVLTQKLTLPQSKVMSSGAQMLAGGIFLFVAAALFGEFPDSTRIPSLAARGWPCSTLSWPDRLSASRHMSGCCTTNRQPKLGPMPM